MIFLFHSHNKVIEIKHREQDIPIVHGNTIAKQLFSLAEAHPNDLIVWCEANQKLHLNTKDFPKLFHHQKMMHSFGNGTYLGDSIGFVEDSPFSNIQPNVQYPTWQMSSIVGGVHASVLNAVKQEAPLDTNFDYFLNSLGKLLMQQGVFCYHNPHLVMGTPKGKPGFRTSRELFRFVKQHYKIRWVFLLFFNFIYFKKRLPLLPLLLSMFFKRRNKNSSELNNVSIQSTKPPVLHFNLDVVIPTMGRREYLYQVLKDLATQQLLPKKVIIVEQNPEQGSNSELDYLTSKTWPFQIIHRFIHQSGACNARNLALKEVTAEWVFLADDDIRMEPDFLEQAKQNLNALQAEVVTFSCLQEDEIETTLTPIQWKSFGSGCSIVCMKTIKEFYFDMGYEHGFGEDADFGMQLRNRGVDVIYLPKPQLTHLKAPVGGFRTRPVLEWENESNRPKPSPTVMLFYLKHRTKEQLQGYKTTLLFKYYKKQSIKKPFRYFRAFKKQWNQSVFWAEKLAGRDRC